MFKMFFKNLVMMFLTVAVIGGVSTTTLPTFNNVHTTDRKSQASNIKDGAVDNQDTHETNINKNSNSSSDTKDNSQNNNVENKQETINPKSEDLNNNTNKQNSINSNSEKSNNNTNKQTTNTQTKNVTNKVNTNNQSNTTSEIKIPTINYDRTTSIYANDNITLLRVEYYKDNKLTYYSVVEQFDAETKSYTEKIYQCNRVTNIDPLIRTDVYANGNLIKSY